MKKIRFIKIVCVILSAVILSACTATAAGTEEPPKTTPDFGKTVQSVLTDEERTEIANLTVSRLESALFGHSRFLRDDRLNYYLENYAPEVYSQIDLSHFPESEINIGSMYGAVHVLELPRWLVRAAFRESGFTSELLEDIINALYVSFDNDGFFRCLCDMADRIRYELVPLQFDELFVMSYLQPYAIEKMNMKEEDGYRKWFFARNMRHSEMLEKYMGVTSEVLVEEAHHPEAHDYTTFWTYEQVSIAEFVHEFDMTSLEFTGLYQKAVDEFGASRFGVSVPGYSLSKISRTEYDNVKTMSAVYGLNTGIRE